MLEGKRWTASPVWKPSEFGSTKFSVDCAARGKLGLTDIGELLSLAWALCWASWRKIIT